MILFLTDVLTVGAQISDITPITRAPTQELH